MTTPTKLRFDDPTVDTVDKMERLADSLIELGTRRGLRKPDAEALAHNAIERAQRDEMADVRRSAGRMVARYLDARDAILKVFPLAKKVTGGVRNPL